MDKDKKKLIQIVLEYFDPKFQPLDMGIIRSDKSYYRKDLVKHNLRNILNKEYFFINKGL